MKKIIIIFFCILFFGLISCENSVEKNITLQEMYLITVEVHFNDNTLDTLTIFSSEPESLRISIIRKQPCLAISEFRSGTWNTRILATNIKFFNVINIK